MGMRLPRWRTVLIAGFIILVIVLAAVTYEKTLDYSPVGTRAKDFQSGLYGTLGFEVDYQAGAQPSADAMSRFLDFAHRYTGKIVFAVQTQVGGPAPKDCGLLQIGCSGPCYDESTAKDFATSERQDFSWPAIQMW